MSNSALNELGFAEFVAKLISDTFSAILSSQVEQKDKIAELDRLMAMSETEFLNMCLADEQMLMQVEEQLRLLFPSEKEPGHTIFAGASYQPKTPRKEESPAIFEMIGLTLSKDEGDFKADKLTQNGVDRIYQAVIEPIAMQQRNSLASIINDGIPKLIVDSGKVNAKLTFQTAILEADATTVEKSESTESSEPTSSVVGVVSPSSSSLGRLSLLSSNRFIGAIDTKKLLNTRLSVVPASNKAPQDAQTTANIYSEVEIHFKTIL
jgi:hypothetical protein